MISKIYSVEPSRDRLEPIDLTIGDFGQNSISIEYCDASTQTDAQFIEPHVSLHDDNTFMFQVTPTSKRVKIIIDSM